MHFYNPKLFLKVALLLVCLFVAIPKNHAYSEVPVLTYIPVENQSDTMGFNLAAQLPELIYQLILSNKIILWDSPKKSIKISADGLQSIENSTGTSFSRPKGFFMNEIWSSNKKKTDFMIVGFSFLNESSNGRVSYGYVDAREAAPFLVREQIRTNVNGPAYFSYMEALYSRRYYFIVTQFGSNKFQENQEEAAEIKEKAFGRNKTIVPDINFPPIKLITYFIDKDPSNPDDGGMILYRGFEKLFADNRELFFDKGGSKYFDFKKYKSELVVTRIEAEEDWIQTPYGIVSIPKRFIVYVNNKKLDAFELEEMYAMKMTIGLKSPEDHLLEKNFQYSLVKINQNFIGQGESELYLRALNEYSWTQLSRFVKYSKQN